MKDELETTRDVGTPCCPAGAASPEDCREFRQERTEASEAGYCNVGICNVERLECPTDDDVSAPKPSHEAREQEHPDPEPCFARLLDRQRRAAVDYPSWNRID